MIYEGQCLWVALLPSCTPVEKEWRDAKQMEALKAFDAIDTLLTMPGRAFPRSRAEYVKSVRVPGGVLLEVRAPQRGKVITRLLCYQPRGYEWYVALVQQKKSQELPAAWVRTAKSRIEDVKRRGEL